jgi:hypothetical protein
MSEMLTAEEKLKANFYNGSFIEIHSGDFEDIKNIMIDFAKLHVEQALKNFLQEIEIQRCLYHHPPILFINKDSIKNAYPLENIK